MSTVGRSKGKFAPIRVYITPKYIMNRVSTNFTKMKRTIKSLIVAFLLILLLIPSLGVQAAEQPRYGGILRIGWRGNPISFNGFLNYWSTSRDLHQQVYNRLIGIDADKNLVPDLAHSWDIEDNGKKFTFYLNKDVRWHDGVPFTSADVKWHWEKLMEPDVVTYVKPKIASLLSVEAPDPYTVVFTFSQTTQPILFAYFQSDTYIHPKHIFDGQPLETNPANMAPVGTGPFKVTEFKPESYCTMVANEDYFKGRPYLDGIVWKIIPSTEARLIAYEAGEIDLTSPPKAELSRMDADPNTGLRWGQSSGTHRITFNYRPEAIAAHPWLAVKEVKQAIAHAIDKQLIIDRVQKGFATIAHTGMGAGAGAWVNKDAQIYEYDPAKAKELLDAAGYPVGSNGFRFEMPWITYDRDYAVQASEIIKAQLKEVGIDMTIIPVEYVTYVSLYEHGENGMAEYPATYNHMGGWPPEEIGSWMHGKPEGGMNMGFYDNAEVDALLDEGAVTTDAAKRKEIYDEVQALNAIELPYIHLFSTEGAYIYNSDFKNMESTRSVTSYKAYDEVWWIHGDLPEAEPEPVAGATVYHYLIVESPQGSTFGEGTYTEDSTAKFSVSPTTVLGESGVRYVFTGWSSTSIGGYTGYDNSASVVMDRDVTETAEWKTQYFLNVETEEGGSVSPKSGWYDEGTSVTLSATSDPGYTFNSWRGKGTGSIIGTQATTTVTMNGPITQSATFREPATYTLTVSSLHGTTTGQGTYDEGTTASFTVTPTMLSGESGVRYVFTGWSSTSIGGYTGSEVMGSMVMRGNVQVKAEWENERYLTVSSDIEVEGTGWYAEGSTVQLEVDSPRGFLVRRVFRRWTGDVYSRDPSVSIVMNGERSVVAEWTTDYSQAILVGIVGAVLVGGGGIVTFKRRRRERQELAESSLRAIVIYHVRVSRDVVVLGDVARDLHSSGAEVRAVIEKAVVDRKLVGDFSKDGRTFITDEVLRKILREKLKDDQEE